VSCYLQISRFERLDQIYSKSFNNFPFLIKFYSQGPPTGFHRSPIPPVSFANTKMSPSRPDNSPSHNTVTKELESKRTPLATNGLANPNIPPHLMASGAFPGLPGSPLMDISSTQVLINMVRNASTIHQNVLGKSLQEDHQHQLHKQLLYQQHLQQQQHQEAASRKYLQNRTNTEQEGGEQTRSHSPEVSL